MNRKTLLSLGLATIFLTQCDLVENSREEYSFNGLTMGTTYTVKIVRIKGTMEQKTLSEIEKRTNDLLKNINHRMSTYDKDSELSRFNRWEDTTWFEVSPEMMTVFRCGLDISKKSGGAFDITVGPLVNLWGFGPDTPDSAIPTDEKIQAEKQRIGYHHLKIRVDPPAIKKDRADVYCDLAAVAKGFAVDRVAEYLDSENLDDFLVEIGGEIRTLGRNQKNRPWKIGIASPDDPGGVYGVVDVSNTAMATSGDYRNFFEKDGIRYSHTIDPSTGRPVRHNLTSVTVIAASCMMADAMATAIDVLGPEKGYELAISEDLAVFMIVRQNGGFLDKMTPQFSTIMTKKGR